MNEPSTQSSHFPDLVHVAPASLDAAVLTVALCFVELLVEPLGPPLNGKAEDDGAQAAEENETTPESVEGLVLGGEEVWREPVRALANTVGDRDQSCLLAARCRNQGRLPRELQVETVVGAADQETGAEVASADVRGGDHD